MTKKLSFMNEAKKIKGQELKAALVEIIIRDKEKEKLQKGSYWNTDDQKGCAVGCCEAAICQILGDQFKDKRHEYLADTLYIPVELFFIQDKIFESLDKTKADQFVVDFVSALPINA